MTTTLTTPTSSHQPSHPRPVLPSKEQPETRPSMLVMLAVCAVVVFASAFTWVLAGGTKIGDLPEDLDEPDGPDATAYNADAASALARLSALEPVASGADREALRAVEEAQTVAASALDATIADAMLAIEEAVAASALPSVPEGYLPGMAVSVHLPAAEGYALPRLPVVRSADDLALSGFEADPSPVGSRSSSGPLPLGDLLAQLEDVQAALEDLVGELPGSDLPVGGLPVGGPSPADDAEGTISPDEEGAHLADLHADTILNATSSVYGQAQTSLEDLLAAYQGLAEQVEQAIADTRELEEETDAAIEATLEERLADIEAQALGLETKARQLAATHARAVAKAQAQADAVLETALRDQVGLVRDSSDEAVADLEARARSVLAEADARQAEIAAILDRAAVELSKPGAPADAAQRFEALKAAATAALAKVDADSQAQVAELERAAEKVRSDARAAVGTLVAAVDEARGELNATAVRSLEQAIEVESYLVAVARAEAEQAGERETELAAAALRKLESLADDHVEGLVRSSLQSAGAASSIVADTASLVGQVEGLAVSEVGKDLDYIQKVSADYSKVPTGDRRERAGHWSTTASEIEEVLGDALATGNALEGLALQTAQAAKAAQAQILAIA